MKPLAHNPTRALAVVLGLLLATAASAAPTLVNPTITESGNNVNVTFRIQDLADNAANNLPLQFQVALCEDDAIYDDRLGLVTVTVPVVGSGPGNSTTTGRNGYLSPTFTHTYPNASNAATGWGDDYYLTLDPGDCPNRKDK